MIMPTLSVTPRAWRIGAIALSALVFAFLIAPILVIVPLSFSADPFFSYPIEHWSLRWYAAMVGDDPQALLWRRAVVNSLIIGLSATLLATCLGTLAAIGVWRSPRPLANAVTALMISPIVVPIVVTAIGTYYFYARLGLVGTYTGIILAHAALGAPFVFLTVAATLASFDETLLKAGAILGAKWHCDRRSPSLQSQSNQVRSRSRECHALPILQRVHGSFPTVPILTSHTAQQRGCLRAT